MGGVTGSAMLSKRQVFRSSIAILLILNLLILPSAHAFSAPVIVADPMKRLDAEVGLYDFGARAYDPAFSRFLTPDLAGPSYSDPQTLNPYSYTRNNPVKLVDPTGEFAVPLLPLLWDAAVWLLEIYSLYATAELTFVTLPQDIQRYRESPSLATGTQLGWDATFAIASVAGAGVTKTGVQAGELTGEIGRGLSTAQREAMAGGRQFQKGVLAAEGLEENRQLITTSIQTRTGLKSVTTRPDAMTATMIEEMKDVKYLSRTKQLRAEIKAAEKSGRQFVLTVSEKVEHITDPLRKALRDADAILRQFDERTGEFIQRDINRFLR